MTAGARYAIYFSPPPESRLWSFGSSVIGYDAGTGQDLAQPAIPGMDPADFRDRTEDPRRYGFHATLKPPFHLAAGESVDTLLTAAHVFAAGRRSFDIPDLEVTAIGAFVALTPAAPCPELNQLADDCVIAFDRFRAPLTEADLQRRLKSPLTPRQIENLDRWGYPYVFEDFRFHLTLTGRLHHDERGDVKAALTALYRPIAAPLPVDGLTVFEQPDRDSRFSVLARIGFG